MTLQHISDQYHVPIKRDSCKDELIPGRNGHLYVDGCKLMVCFTDDGRKDPLTPNDKKTAIRKLRSGLKLKQEGDCEFTAEIAPALVKTALFEVLECRFTTPRRIHKGTQKVASLGHSGRVVLANVNR